MNTIKYYRGYAIEHNVYNGGEYSVQYYGDDCIFSSIEAAKEFIDEVKEIESDDCDWISFT